VSRLCGHAVVIMVAAAMIRKAIAHDARLLWARIVGVP
jgi:hypothetical protein